MIQRSTLLLTLISIIVLPGVSFGQKGHGLEFDSRQYKSTKTRPFLVNAVSRQLPLSASVKEYCPKPLSQRMENTSPGWAAAYGARTIIEARTLGLTDVNEITKMSFSPVFNYFLAKPETTDDCSIPVKLPTLLESMKTYGTPKYLDYRKSCPTQITDDIYQKAYEHRISDFYRIFDEEDNMNTKVDNVKQSLINGSPVIIGMYSTSSFENVRDEFWQPREKLDPEGHPGHALVVVGYDDTKFTGAFEVMNSWGTDWGNEGFMWIRYKDFYEFVKYGFELFVMDPSTLTSGNLSGEVEIPLLSGGDMESTLADERDGYYVTNLKYEDKTSFNIVIRSLEKSFVYVVGSDQTETIYEIFPDPWVSPAIPYSNHNLVIRDMGIDDTPGSNYLCVIFSKHELAMSDIVSKLNEFKGKEFRDKFHIAFYSRLIPPDKINFETNKIKFQGTRDEKDLIGIILEIRHD